MWRLGKGHHSWASRRVGRVLGWVAWVKTLQRRIIRVRSVNAEERSSQTGKLTKHKLKKI